MLNHEVRQLSTKSSDRAFELAISHYPKNPGVMGDQGVRGHTPLISMEADNPAAYVGTHADALTIAVGRIIGETGGACRVLFDITPGGGYFKTAPPESEI